MHRCSQVVADACTAALAKLITRSGALFLEQLTFNASLKRLMLSDPKISINIVSATTFEIVEMSGPLIISDSTAIASARLSDFFLGACRAQNQYQNVLKLKNAGGNSAWVLVSAYYAAYFASIELSKLFNKISMSLDSEDLTEMRIKAAGPNHAAFFETGNMNFVGHEFAGKIVFNSVGTRPHAAAWQNALHSLRPIWGALGWDDAESYLALLDDANCSPSAVRNVWNYKRADYFGSPGEKRSAEFRKLIGNPPGAHAWLKQRRGLVEALEPCVVAVFYEALTPAVIDASRRAAALLKQEAEWQRAF
jgi:hypothetical protein